MKTGMNIIRESNGEKKFKDANVKQDQIKKE